MSDGMHTDHRQRMRNRIMNAGIAKLEPHEVLEYLLYAFIPRKDTNGIAHTLIKEFGSLPAVFNASPEHLRKVPGMTDNASLFISVFADIARKYVVLAQSAEKKVLSTPAAVSDYLGKQFIGLNEERVYAVALDNAYRVISQKDWTNNNPASVDINPKDIVVFAQACKAVSVIIAHNHPGGIVTPSQEDIDLTRDIYFALDIMGFELNDHMIFNDKNNCYSFQQNGYIAIWQKELKDFKEGLLHL